MRSAAVGVALEAVDAAARRRPARRSTRKSSLDADPLPARARGLGEVGGEPGRPCRAPRSRCRSVTQPGGRPEPAPARARPRRISSSASRVAAARRRCRGRGCRGWRRPGSAPSPPARVQHPAQPAVGRSRRPSTARPAPARSGRRSGPVVAERRAAPTTAPGRRRGTPLARASRGQVAAAASRPTAGVAARPTSRRSSADERRAGSSAAATSVNGRTLVGEASSSPGGSTRSR